MLASLRYSDRHDLWGRGTVGLAVVSVAITAISSAVVTWHYAHRLHKAELEKWRERRQEERTGRIRAEVQLRTFHKEREQESLRQKQEEASANDKNHCMLLHAIGHVVSPYTKRMGTPRQPQLVPASRGFIQFTAQTAPAACLEGIDDYSHVWILFQFHANTNLPKQNNKTPKTKIQPPRCPYKVGQLATRSPHRPNPIGLSLVRVEHWNAQQRRLHISGLDLVHGTPVFDVKPCVPWDVPGYYQQQRTLKTTPQSLPFPSSLDNDFKVPFWVEQDDEIATVSVSDDFIEQVSAMVQAGRLYPLYTIDNDGVDAAVQTLRQVVAQDPRSVTKRKVINQVKTKTGSADNDAYHLIFGQCQVDFVVSDDGALLLSMTPIDFDLAAFVDGVPLVSEAKLGQMEG